MAGIASVRIDDLDDIFFAGVKSDTDPSKLPLGNSWMAVNMVNVGGVWSCRPGYRCVFQLPDGNLQGATLFRPLVGVEQIIFAVDGLVYVSDWPFINFRKIDGIQFEPFAKQLFWCLTTQSAARATTAFDSPIKVTSPKAVLLIQDGGSTAPAYWDGLRAAHIKGNFFETPLGGPMAWVGDRLWVASGNQLFASDIANPLSFREQIYLGGSASFFFSSEITALVKTPSIESPQLMVFTGVDGSIIQANIRNRSQWPITPNFQMEIIQVGCLSNRSALSHYGRVVWYSPSGIALFDPAQSGKITTRLPVRDNEMMYSKAIVSDDLSMVASAAFGQYLLCSVPAEDSYNKHTWCLNHASLTTLQDDSGPSWSGYWLGTRPVEWIYGQIGDVERCFHVSVDHDGKNRLWEAFQPDRLDNGCPITWGLFTRGYFGATLPLWKKQPKMRCRLQWADLNLAAIAEDLDLAVFYAGSTRGTFRRMLTKLVKVEKGSLSFQSKIDAQTPIFQFKAQSRLISTEDVNQQTPGEFEGACPVETEDAENVDRSFQLLIVGQGPATLCWVRPWALLVPERISGDGKACQDENGVNAVRYDGFGVQACSHADAAAALAAVALQEFTSNQTQLLSQGGFSAIGTGYSQSIISQEAADRVASIIATKVAENELAFLQPPIVSQGLE